MPMLVSVREVMPGTQGFFFATDGGSTPPAGWLKANGAAVSRTAYAALFAVIGTAFGAGDGATTFNLPDNRGLFIRGWDDGRGFDSGRVLGSYQADQFQSHGHDFNGSTIGVTSGGVSALQSNASVMTTGGPNSGSFGGETRPKNMAFMACIKY